ncbi:hypothetical protein LAZ67_16002574 [Cordylochernes scorpioides]|uniref:Uncharacterized protein n=1 Tax=Cordylochernes scorpioides TaxID=51811 RepID=A0ABY6LCF0_9ARAC|nr:hypothetical protein LAZ67_16002574 [Cordylochernes scorpioides]
MESVKDEKCVGRPILHRNPEKVSQISNLIKENPRIGLQDIEEKTGISKSLVGSIIEEDLQLKKTPSKFVPKMLTIQQKENRVEVAKKKKMLEMVEENPNWKEKVITGDKTWVYGQDERSKLKLRCVVQNEELHQQNDNNQQLWDKMQTVLMFYLLCPKTCLNPLTLSEDMCYHTQYFNVTTVRIQLSIAVVASQAVAAEYGCMQSKCDLNAEVAAQVMKKASELYRQNQALKRQSVLLLDHIPNRETVLPALLAVEEEVDAVKSEAALPLHQVVEDLTEQLAQVQKELSLAKQELGQLRQENTELTEQLAFISEGRSPICHLGTRSVAVSSAKGFTTMNNIFEVNTRLHKFHEFMLLELFYDEQRPLPKVLFSASNASQNVFWSCSDPVRTSPCREACGVQIKRERNVLARKSQLFLGKLSQDGSLLNDYLNKMDELMVQIEQERMEKLQLQQEVASLSDLSVVRELERKVEELEQLLQLSHDKSAILDREKDMLQDRACGWFHKWWLQADDAQSSPKEGSQALSEMMSILGKKKPSKPYVPPPQQQDCELLNIFRRRENKQSLKKSLVTCPSPGISVLTPPSEEDQTPSDNLNLTLSSTIDDKAATDDFASSSMADTPSSSTDPMVSTGSISSTADVSTQSSTTSSPHCMVPSTIDDNGPSTGDTMPASSEIFSSTTGITVASNTDASSNDPRMLSTIDDKTILSTTGNTMPVSSEDMSSTTGHMVSTEDPLSTVQSPEDGVPSTLTSIFTLTDTPTDGQASTPSTDIRSA